MRVSVKPKITAEMAQALLTCHGWSQYKIAKEFCISSKTVSSIANRIYVKKVLGRKPKYNEEHIAYIVECVFLNPRASTLAIARKFMVKFPQIKISDETVRKIIKKHGYKYLYARKIQKLTESQIAIRYNFACSMLNAFDEYDDFWKMLNHI